MIYFCPHQGARLFQQRRRRIWTVGGGRYSGASGRDRRFTLGWASFHGSSICEATWRYYGGRRCHGRAVSGDEAGNRVMINAVLATRSRRRAQLPNWQFVRAGPGRAGRAGRVDDSMTNDRWYCSWLGRSGIPPSVAVTLFLFTSLLCDKLRRRRHARYCHQSL